MNKQAGAKELLERFGPNLTCNIVTAGFENEVPSNYNVTIIEIGANFTYDDGSDESYGPYNVNIGYGNSQVIMSQCTDKCCVRVFGASKVQQSGHEPVIVTGDHHAPNGECILTTRFVLELKQTVTKERLAEALKSGTAAQLFELVVR